MTFILENFIASCKTAISAQDAQEHVRELVAEAISSPEQVVRQLGEPQEGGLNTLYCDDDLTIINIIWAPEMTLHAHNHCMWANIGIYGGREENNFFQRTPEGLQQNGQAILNQSDVAPLHRDVIHSVHNPLSSLTAAIHVYGGNFFTAPRSEWDPGTLEEHPFDIEHTRAVFAEANKLFQQKNSA